VHGLHWGNAGIRAEVRKTAEINGAKRRKSGDLKRNLQNRGAPEYAPHREFGYVLHRSESGYK
jgi:hypothetical protein